MTTYAIVLAAGRSTRFDGGKLTHAFAGKPLLQHALTAAQAAFPGKVVLVTGQDADSVVNAAGNLADHIVFNPDYASGQGSSLAIGARACRDDADAIVVMLADQPLVDAATLERLVSCWGQDPKQIVVSDYGDALGPPALFGRACFDLMSELTGDSGARSIIRSGQFDVVKLSIGSRGFDVDTPQDLQAANQRLSAKK